MSDRLYINGNILLTFILVFLTSLASAHINDVSPPIVQPGAPGQETRDLDVKSASDIADTSFTSDDIEFMQGMILHHYQAMIMSEMAEDRTNSNSVIELAGKILVTQDDEVDFMQNWLRDRGEIAIDPAQYSQNHAHHDMAGMNEMAGMATLEELEELERSNSTDFDRLFLKLMINHHDGAIKMVDHLRKQKGSAYDPILNEFASDVVNDQAVEIERMNYLLVTLSDDPRAGLDAGLYDAGEAILNLELISSLSKPAGFYDPNNPTGLYDDKEENTEDAKSEDDKKIKSIEKTASDRRSPMLSFSNTDIAFRDDVLIAGSYHGFNIYRMFEGGVPALVSSIICPGGQGDVSVVGDLLIMSVEETRGRVDCGRQGAGSEPTPDRFRGIRIFDISDLRRPKQVGIVQTCRGSHTHSVVSGPDDEGKIIVYNSGTSSIRDNDELDTCIGDIAGDNRTALFRIDIIEIPVDDPSKSKIVSSPTVFADPETGALAGLWRGGDHGDDTQTTRVTEECHDITVFPSANLAAGACSGNGILFDITDPYDPVRLDAVSDEGFAYWHSATFNNDGTKIVFTDEWGGGGRPRCRAWDPLTWGADAIYDIVDGKLEYKSHYKMPAPQLETENCVAHNGSIIPIPGRDIFVQAWYQGGISVIDFTDSENPKEIAYFDRGPIDEEQLVTGGYWSVYYYEGYIYATEIVRGLDVFKLIPSEYISEDEIAAAAAAYPAQGYKRVFNPQQQVPMAWPREIIKSYNEE